MEVKEIQKTTIILNEEEKKAIQKVVEILMDIEDCPDDLIQMLEDEYLDYIGGAIHGRTLANAIDYLSMLEEKAEEA